MADNVFFKTKSNGLFKNTKIPTLASNPFDLCAYSSKNQGLTLEPSENPFYTRAVRMPLSLPEDESETGNHKNPSFLSQDDYYLAHGVYLDNDDGTPTHPLFILPENNDDLLLSPADKLDLSKAIWDMNLTATQELEAFRVLYSFVYDPNYESQDGEIFVVGYRRAYRQALQKTLGFLNNSAFGQNLSLTGTPRSPLSFIDDEASQVKALMDTMFTPDELAIIDDPVAMQLLKQNLEKERAEMFEQIKQNELAQELRFAEMRKTSIALENQGFVNNSAFETNLSFN